LVSAEPSLFAYHPLSAIDQVALGSGASDIVDLIMKTTCTPGQDKILIAPPTFDLYNVCATLQGVGVVECVQDIAPGGEFRIPLEKVHYSIACIEHGPLNA
jgi:histidinol-phosphate aminotransferase